MSFSSPIPGAMAVFGTDHPVPVCSHCIIIKNRTQEMRFVKRKFLMTDSAETVAELVSLYKWVQGIRFGDSL